VYAALALVLTSGCASQNPPVAATQKTSATGDDQVKCSTELPTGTMIPTKVCQSKAAGDRSVQDIKDALADAKNSPHPGGSTSN
jgi:hypothetical protein